MEELYLSHISPWAPGLLDNKENWQKWAKGESDVQIEQTKDSPKLEYTDPLFRRRLSQISKMTIHTIHNLIESVNAKNPDSFDKETKIVFCSLRGEIEREFTINKSLIEDEMILPAGFSLSVFNTPVALATLAFKLTGGYSVLYPSKNNFADCFKAAVAPLLAGTEEQIIFVYADELVPEVYGQKRPAENIPFSFATLISTEKKDKAIRFSIDDLQKISSSPIAFLKDFCNI
ncbi:MAG: beta-ketoacyl synthase chain length factor [Treponema sp.]|nr:beta-ketoacyl synthase chain length factor [Treponema sp.]